MSDRRTPTDRVREILDLAMERPSVERTAFVAGAAGSDEQLRGEVMSLLAALEGAGDVLEPPRATHAEPTPAEPLTGLAFGPYVVGERIGEGGMGVVYATRDTRLGRMVAVKALPPTLARDPHRKARLEREARLLATLNHPNIASVYGIEDTSRGPVVVMEFVPGRTLSEEIATRRISVDESISIARQIARGLESAHLAGVVHRDLKPANIKITPEGMVKILDLGVAKADAGVGREMGSDSVLRAAATMPGVIVGTAAYMSPEQARGRPVDRRADLWALGCVVYEMLTGRRAFDGETGSDAMAAVLRAEPDWSLLPAETPAGARRMLSRCLRKDPEQRLRDAGDAAIELDDQSEPNVSEKERYGVWWVAAAAVLIGALAFAAWRWGQPRTKDAPVYRFSVPTPPLSTGSVGSSLALSPDGRVLAYFAGAHPEEYLLHLQRLDSLTANAIPGTERSFIPFFSPDSRWVGFCAVKPDGGCELRRVQTIGGPVQNIVALPGSLFGASWGDDDSIVYSTMSGTLWRVPAFGGEPVALEPPVDGQLAQHSQPEMLPGSREVLYTNWQRAPMVWRSRVEVLSIATGKSRILIDDASQPKFMRARGMLAFHQRGSLLAAPLRLDGVRLKPDEPPVLIATIGGEGSGAYPRYAVSDGGDLAIIPGEALAEETDLAWFGSDGVVSTVFRGSSQIWTLRLSPDAARVAYTIFPPKGDLWVLDIERSAPMKLTSTGNAFYPVWTPDGKRIAFQRQDEDGKSRIEWTAADGSGAPETLYEDPGGAGCFPTGFSPDGRLLAISVQTGKGDVTDVAVVNIDGDRKATRLFETPADRVGVRFSPDGSMIAYCSVESGRAEIYIHPYPAMDKRALGSTTGGERPTWSADGKRLFYRYGSTIYAVDVSPPPNLSVGKPVVVLDKLPGMRYDAMPDGSRFIMGRPRGDWAPKTSINIVTNAVPRGSK